MISSTILTDISKKEQDNHMHGIQDGVNTNDHERDSLENVKRSKVQNGECM
jgi:hypothetical protein